MKTFSKYFFAAAISSMSFGAMADVNIDFESNSGFKSVSMYDVWEESPFRTGELKGNWALTANPDSEINEMLDYAPNPSATVLGAQRSRFGSNRFGVRIDLDESFALTPTLQYVHVMIHKPKAGRVMLVGLGSRTERTGQNPYCEQFWQLSSNTVTPGMWCDAVFPIKGFKGIDIRSLVVMPDVESPHDLDEDFLFYIDNIELNSSPLPRVIYEYYAITGSKTESQLDRSDRYTNAVSITIDGEEQSVGVNQQENHLLYQNHVTTTFIARPGQTIKPEIKGKMTYMHGYCYIDYNNDGRFNAEINPDGTPAEGSEIVSYNSYGWGKESNWRNSKGEAVSDGVKPTGCGILPEFTLPADLEPGMYRMRFKIDWDSIDPMGNPGDDTGHNLINNNGGVIVDVMLNVVGPAITVRQNQLNGDIFTADGTVLNSIEVPSMQPLAIKSAPANGFHNGGVNVKVGYNLDGEQINKYGNPQYSTFFIPARFFNEEGIYTIPARKVTGNIFFEGVMVSDPTPGTPEADATPYKINFPADSKVTRSDRKLNSITLAVTGETDTTLTITSKTVYQQHLDLEIPAQAGATITPTVNYNGNAMHTYWYVDLDEDGTFTNSVDANGLPTGEMLSYSCYNNKNSLGGAIDRPGALKPDTNHPFTIPATTEPGLYRCRFKIDWDCIDPGARTFTEANKITDNGGFIIDFYIHVYSPKITVTSEIAPEYGEMKTTGGKTLPAAYITPKGQAINIAELTTGKYYVNKLRVLRGYHTEIPAEFAGKTFWEYIDIAPNPNGTLTIPAAMVDRPLHITGEFDLTGIHELYAEPAEKKIYDLRGVRVNKPERGIYIVNGKKVAISNGNLK